MDEKALRGVWKKKDEPSPQYALSVYDVQQGKVMSQVEVGRKENEISKADEALQLVNISGNVLTGDAMYTHKRLSTQILEGQGDFVFPVKENQENCTKAFSPCLLLNIQSQRTSTKVMVVWKFERSKPVKCLMPIRAGQVWHKSIA